MKKIVPPIVILLIYIAFILFSLSPSGPAHHPTGIYDVVVGHLTDYPIKEAVVNPNDFIIVKLQKYANNVIARLNENVLSKIRINLGVIEGDMRITKWVCMLFLSFTLCLVVFIPISRSIRKSVEGSKSRWVNLWEVLIGFLHDEIVEPYFDHKHIPTAMPYFCTVFFFVLFCNLLGLIPGLTTATGNLAVTGGMALFTLLGMIVVGSVKQGPLWIFAGVVPHGLPFLMYFLLWPIEVAGLVIKPFALTIRLFANMTAGHVVIIIFIYLVMMFQIYAVGIGSIILSLMIYLLELLVAFIQAYIFTTLSAMFIGSSVHAH